MGDGWDTEESGFNQIGIYVTLIPAVLGALLMAGFVPIEVPAGVMFGVVAVGGIVGGILNVLGRGPVAAGAVIGLVMALGGFGAVYWWVNGRESVRKFEVAIAFIVGAAPGFLLQYVIQQVRKKQMAEV